MKLDVDVGQTKDYFRVKKLIDELKLEDESGLSSDFKKRKLSMLINIASNLVKDIDVTTDSSKIKGLKFSGTSIINDYMTENQLLEETMKALEEHLDIDTAIQNLVALVKFWKESSRQMEMYKPLLQEMMDLMNDIKEQLDDSAHVDEIKGTIRDREIQIKGLQTKLADLTKELEEKKFEVAKWQKSLRPLVNNIDTLHAFLEYKAKLNPFEDTNTDLLTDVVIYLILMNGRDTLLNVCRELDIPMSTLVKLINDYKPAIQLTAGGKVLVLGKLKAENFDAEKYVNEMISGTREKEVEKKLDAEEKEDRPKINLVTKDSGQVVIEDA